MTFRFIGLTDNEIEMITTAITYTIMELTRTELSNKGFNTEFEKTKAACEQWKELRKNIKRQQRNEIKRQRGT